MSKNPNSFDDVTELNPPAFQGQLPITTERYFPTLTWSDTDGKHSAQIEADSNIGSAQGNDVRIGDPSVSRVHARLELRGRELWITDLGSRNGTWIDRIRVTGAQVPDGAVLRIGGTDIGVSYGQKMGSVPLWPKERFGPLLGRSNVMREMFRRLEKVAKTDSTVLIQGETGTGKELVAQAIHEASPRAKAPFVVVDCGAIPRDLMEAELFGHVKGAFTGAIGQREGAIESADGGTVFFDEFGEIPMALQPKLLRVIESRMVRRVGEAQHRQVDVRFIVATHRDLATMVNQGAFREDLYFRVAVVPVHVPPLRDRKEDIPTLLEHFLPRGTYLDQNVMRELEHRPWLGNVRELRNFADRAMALGINDALAANVHGSAAALAAVANAAAATAATAPAIPQVAGAAGAAPTAGDLPNVNLDTPFKELRDQWLNYLEREYIRGWLEKSRWNVSAVAERVGLDRTYVHRLIKKHELER